MTTSIAAKISLALAVKIKALFEQPDRKDKFLSFPKGIAFTYDFLKFMLPPGESGLSATAQDNYKIEFARMMNASFEDSPQFLPDTSAFLWDAYEAILNNSVFPESTLTEQEEKQLLEATQFLSVTQSSEDGPITVPSPQYKAYVQYKTLFDQAEKAYLDEKLSTETTTGPEGDERKRQWREYREKQLFDFVSQANTEWITFGNKTTVERYVAVKTDLEQRKYAILTANSYKNDLNLADLPDKNANGLPTKLTFYSPHDIANKSTPWTSIHLSKDEINVFADGAPAELKALLDGGSGNDDIEAVSLEYNTLFVVRPWFPHEYFASRYWKLPDNFPDPVMSDGLIPCSGKAPVYISSIIVGRNITITRKATMHAMSAAPLILPILSTVSVNTVAPVSAHMSTDTQASMLFKPQHTAIIKTQAINPKLSGTRAMAEPAPTMARRFKAGTTVAPSVSDRQPFAARLNYASLNYNSTVIATPIIKIPPAKATSNPAVPLDLVQLAADPSSRWASGQLVDAHNTADNASLPWMGSEGDSRGFVRSGTNVVMEDGRAWPSVLRTHPKWVNHGTIKGWLAWRPIPAGAHFQTQVGFLQGAAGTDGVTFWVWVHYLIGGFAGNVEQWKPVAQHFKKYSQSLDTIDVDLSAYAGQSISIELRVDAGGSSGQDWAAWVSPTIIGVPAHPGTDGPRTELVTETFPFDGVFVLAYACKRLPKSPNPDPTLKWT
ncbi:MAG: hypothetical protein HOO98_15530 [Nitrospira sp.]|nr:hypothetical protein [Nitrospira sp.]